ncbi:MAG: tetratricopeptide repeat protein [Cyanobacteria bacterium J06621_11]
MLFFRAGVLIVATCFWLMCGLSAFADSPLAGLQSSGSIASSVVTTQIVSEKTADAQDNSVEEMQKAGAVAIAEGRYDEALRQFTKSIEQSPAPGYGNRCLVHLQMQHYRAAIEDCTESLAIAQNPEVKMNLGLAYEQIGEHALAIIQYESMISANIADYRVYYNLALAEAATGAHQMAIGSYTQALRELPADVLNPIQGDIYRDRGASYLVLANYVAAVTDLNAAIRYDPNDLWAYFNRGCAYHRSHNFLPALQDFNWVIEKDSHNARAYFNRGMIYARLGQSTVAIENLTQALQRFPKDAQSKDMLVSIHQAQQLIDQLESEAADSTVFSFLRDRPLSS